MALVSYGEFYFAVPAATALGLATPAKAAGTTSGSQLGGFTSPINNRLLYSDADTRTFFVCCAVSITKAGGSQTSVTLYVYKNGVAVDGLRAVRSATNNAAAASVAGLVQLATGDYLELWLETANGDDVTVQAGTLSTFSVG